MPGMVNGWTSPAGKAVNAEVYPSVFRKRHPAVEPFGDEQDASATARWLSDMASSGTLATRVDPPPSLQAQAMASERVDNRGAATRHLVQNSPPFNSFEQHRILNERSFTFTMRHCSPILNKSEK